MQQLSGGRPEITRSEEGVHRPAGAWSANVHWLLNELQAHGFNSAPRFLHFDDQGREVLSFIPGLVGNDPLPEAFRSEQTLVSAAKLLRAYHDASALTVSKLRNHDGWQLPARHPVEVVCHGDFAPYNVVVNGAEAIGLIDFDVAHPGPKIWDVAYAVYRWAPITAPANDSTFGAIDYQIERAALFCKSYNLEWSGSLADMICLRLNALTTFMRTMADRNDPQYIRNLADGHLDVYYRDIDYIMLHRDKIDQVTQ